MQTNNKMREALAEALEHVNNVYDILSKSCVEIEKARQGCREARGVLIPALAAPPRNCDKSRDYILAALKREKNIDPIFTVRMVVDFMLAEAKEGAINEQ